MKCRLLTFLLLAMVAGSGCTSNYISDVNVSMPKYGWSYINKVIDEVEVKDHTKTYDLYFKLRHTAKYRYGNIYILFHFKAPGKKTVTRRFEYKLADSDGRWRGAGSGYLYSYSLPLLKNFRFPAPGKYTLTIEPSMVDNPLHDVSDAGITVVKQEEGK